MGVARKMGFGENSVWSSTPRLVDGLLNMLEGWIEGAARTEDAKRPRIEGEAWDWAGRGGMNFRKFSGEGLGKPLPRKISKINIWNHAFWCIVEAEIYILEFSDFDTFIDFDSNFDTFIDFDSDFDTFQSNAYFGVEESPFSKTCTWWSK